MTGFGLLLAAGCVLVTAALAAAARSAHRLTLLLAVAGEAAVGAGVLARAWPLTAAAWTTGAYLTVQWVQLWRKARRQ